MLATVPHLPTYSPLTSLGWFLLAFGDADGFFVDSARPLRKRRGPRSPRGRRTPRHPSAPCPHTCSSARTGARGSKLRTLTPVSVSLWSCTSVATVTGADGTRLTGEIGKLLGAKWKELDEEEKKVRLVVVAARRACILGWLDVVGPVNKLGSRAPT